MRYGSLAIYRPYRETTQSPATHSFLYDSIFLLEAVARSQCTSRLLAMFETDGEYLLRSVLRIEPAKLPPIDIDDAAITASWGPCELERDGDVGVPWQIEIE